MDLSDTLDVAIGLVFVYLVFALLASRVNEWFATVLQWRAKNLSRGLAALVGPPAPPPEAEPEPADPARQAQPKSADPAQRAQPKSTTAALIGDFRSSALPQDQSPSHGDGLLSAERVKEHPLVKAFDSGLPRNRRISYLPGETFARAVLDIVSGLGANGEEPPLDEDRLQQIRHLLGQIDSNNLTGAGRSVLKAASDKPTRSTVQALGGAIQQGDFANLAVFGQVSALLPGVLDLVRANLPALEAERNPAAGALRSYLETSGGDVQTVLDGLASWFDEQMNRLSGAYKRQVQLFIASFAVIVTVICNVDTIAIAEDLWSSPVDRAAVAAAAGANAKKPIGEIESEISKLPGLHLPLGWDFATPSQGSGQTFNPRGLPSSPIDWVKKLFGLALSAFAINFGAPFWFDTLGKLANVRNAGRKPAVTASSQE